MNWAKLADRLNHLWSNVSNDRGLESDIIELGNDLKTEEGKQFLLSFHFHSEVEKGKQFLLSFCVIQTVNLLLHQSIREAKITQLHRCTSYFDEECKEQRQAQSNSDRIEHWESRRRHCIRLENRRWAAATERKRRRKDVLSRYWSKLRWRSIKRRQRVHRLSLIKEESD